VGIISGCIPVIFDGGDGSGLYGNRTPTFWPWRVFDTPLLSKDPFQRTIHRIGLDYARFCVVVGVTDLLNPITNFAKDLQKMYRDDPKQVRRLQLGVDEAAPAMVYLPSSPRIVTSPGSAPIFFDAFARLFTLLSSLV
jgi:hypothetical protein